MKQKLTAKNLNLPKSIKDTYLHMTELEENIVRLLKKLKIEEKISLNDVKDIVWNANENNLISRMFSFILEGLSKKDSEETLNILQDAWNFFPHKKLNGLSPRDMLERCENDEYFSADDRTDFYEVFEDRFPEKTCLKNVLDNVWAFEYPIEIQELGTFISDFDKVKREIEEGSEYDNEDGDDDFPFEGEFRLNMLIDIFKENLKEDPTFFAGAIRVATQEYKNGNEKEAQKILERSIASARGLFPNNFTAGKDEIHWSLLDNRPFLLLLGEHATLTDMLQGASKAIPLYEEIISLNPNDNTGIRSLLATAYIKTNYLEKLLKLKSQYPEDLMQNLTVGSILALLKLDKREEARKEIKNSFKYSKHVFDELLKTNHTQPEMSPYGVTVGGADEAFLYWQDQGNFWMATRGAIEFLREVCDGIKK